MLTLVIPPCEVFNNETQEFSFTKEVRLRLEHSLVSISKWEARWHVPFLSNNGMSRAQTIDYIRCMTITQNVSPDAYRYITDDNIKTVMKYIENPMTATTIKKSQNRPSRQIVTNEVIYYWMIELGIPMDCEKWHLNRLLTLVEVCNEKHSKPKKMSQNERIAQQRELNAQRRAKYHTRG